MTVDPVKRPNIQQVLDTSFLQDRMQSHSENNFHNLAFASIISEEGDESHNENEIEVPRSEITLETHKDIKTKGDINKKRPETAQPFIPAKPPEPIHKRPEIKTIISKKNDKSLIDKKLVNQFTTQRSLNSKNKPFQSPSLSDQKNFGKNPPKTNRPNSPIKEKPNDNNELKKRIKSHKSEVNKNPKSENYERERVERVKKRDDERKKMMEEISKLKKQTKGNKHDVVICLVQHNEVDTLENTDEIIETSDPKNKTEIKIDNEKEYINVSEINEKVEIEETNENIEIKPNHNCVQNDIKDNHSKISSKLKNSNKQNRNEIEESINDKEIENNEKIVSVETNVSHTKVEGKKTSKKKSKINKNKKLRINNIEDDDKPIEYKEKKAKKNIKHKAKAEDIGFITAKGRLRYDIENEKVQEEYDKNQQELLGMMEEMKSVIYIFTVDFKGSSK